MEGGCGGKMASSVFLCIAGLVQGGGDEIERLFDSCVGAG